MKVAIVGAGNIGLYVGARLIEAGGDVVFVGRERMQEHLKKNGLKVSSYLNQSYAVPNEKLHYFTDYSLMGEVDYVLITVKTTHTADVLRSLTPYLQAKTKVINLQNGVGNSEMFEPFGLKQALIEGMVVFNVIVNDRGELYQAISGPVIIDESIGSELKRLLAAVKFEFKTTHNIAGYKWSKLLLNLNNSLNAISGIPIKSELSNRYFRKVFAGLMRETLKIADAKSIKLEKLTPVHPKMIPYILTLPDFLYKRVARKMIDIDPEAKSSMLMDLERNMATEIDYLNGKIVSFGKENHIPVPFNAKVLELIKQAEIKRAGPPKVEGKKLWKMMHS